MHGQKNIKKSEFISLRVCSKPGDYQGIHYVIFMFIVMCTAKLIIK